MNRTRPQNCLAMVAGSICLPFSVVRRSGLVLAVLLVALQSLHAISEDDQYLQIYNVIELADSLAAKGETAQALSKYREAQIALQSFKKANLNWNTKLVSYRAKYLADRVAALSGAPSAITNAPTTTGSTSPRDTAPPTTSGVKLLEAGAEPRSVLRLHPKPGNTQTLTTSMKVAMEMAMGEMPSQPIKMPAITLVSDFKVKDVSADGEITYEMVIISAEAADDPGVMPQVTEALKPALAKMKGLSGSGTMSDRGRSKALEMKATAGSDPQSQQLMDQMKDGMSAVVAPLPEEPVGPGARWEVKAPIKSQGMTIEQTVTYQITSLDGERVVIKSDIAQRAANQKIQVPAMPGMKVDLTRMTGKGSGETTIDLAQIMPTAGNAEIHTDLSLAMNAGGQAQKMGMKTDVNLRIETK